VKTAVFHRMLAAVLISEALGIFLSGCRANPLGSGSEAVADATVVLTVAGPWTSGGSRLILGNATWLRVELSADGATTTYDHDVADASFELRAELGKTYTVKASAGNGTDNTLYAASTTLTVGESQELNLFLLPVETTAWTEIDTDSYTIAPGALAAQTSVTYRVRLGAAARWYINTPTGYGTDLQLYVQNEDGSAVAPSAYAADRLVVEKSNLASGATSFILTMYNASTTAISADDTDMISARDAYAGTLLFHTTLTDGLEGTPGDITYLNGKLYIALYAFGVYSIDTDGYNGAPFTATAYNPFGIATDGTSLYVGDQDGNALRFETGSPTPVWSSAIPNASGIAALGSNVYVSYNGWDLIYRVPKDTGGTASIIAGQPSADSSIDDVGIDATFHDPAGMCTDGSCIYVVQTAVSDKKIRRIDPTTLSVTTFAGNATNTIVDGIGTAASFSSLNHIVSDGTYLYVTDYNTLRRIEIATQKVETMYQLPSIGSGLVKVGDAIYVVNNGSSLYKIY